MTPFVAALFGAIVGGVITYVVQTRLRIRSRREDAIWGAIKATSAVIAVSDPVVHDSGWEGATSAQVARLNEELGINWSSAWLRAVSDARAAIVHASTHDPSLEKLIRSSPRAFTRDAEQNVATLLAALPERSRRRR